MKLFCSLLVSAIPSKKFISALFWAASQELQYRKKLENQTFDC